MYSSEFLIDYHKRLWKFIKEHISDMRIGEAKAEFSSKNLSPSRIGCVGCVIARTVATEYKCDDCPFDSDICFGPYSDYIILCSLNYRLHVEGLNSGEMLALAYKLCDNIINAEFDEEIINKYDKIFEETCP